MKKGNIILIVGICIISIVIVAFFGVSAKNISPIVYMESVEILDMRGKEIEINKYGIKQLTLVFESGDEYVDEDGKHYMQYFFNTKILPDNATSNEVSYYCDKNEYIELTSSKGAMIIKEKNTGSTREIMTINCKANDGGPIGVNDDIALVIDYREWMGIE